MDAVLEVNQPVNIPHLLALDQPDRCLLCKPAEVATGGQQLDDLAQWWLSEEQRTAWGVETFIEGRQESELKGMDAIFKIRHPDRSKPIFVFYVLVQHWDKKKLPHYQLQISFSARSMGLSGENAELVEDVEELFDQAREQTTAFRHEGLISISLHDQLPAHAITAIREAISELVIGLVALDWTV
ncbi:hypothetical protein GobsT_50360 [Gemmata obscuriglobus]|uniref:Uncharacterized protein n=1 Tax=Gemmata obscuriglobus TaxID=114 RepID=A0A2Z3H1P6_9BACT|nr:hypothetical protein [Gemmata obscuriglobus]AWM37055.1 hypothetical protein C1280_08490 [Gemmata obscuriglobus]QEG30233.1 hypothetical protein GobsT_50360 [Gemmata obscuriglobus]VTS09557.1 unnamed protein product [Gemmata obscuriglobus UQM 2246]